MYHSGHKVMHNYLVHQGMNPNDAHHVVINSGSGIADWFKKHKKTILKVLGTTAGVAGTALGAYAGHQKYRKAQRRAPMFYFDDEGYGSKRDDRIQRSVGRFGRSLFNLFI